MKDQYYDILQGFAVDELRVDGKAKQAIKACAELMLNTSVDFATATSLATLLVAHLKHVEPSEDFAAGCEENTPHYYSGEVAYVSFFLLYLCEKARTLSDLLYEKRFGCQAKHYLINGADDADTCDKCGEMADRKVPMEQA
ncbi:MAG: hypothetical protein RR224_12620, partial [Clostridia bacterium]